MAAGGENFKIIKSTQIITPGINYFQYSSDEILFLTWVDPSHHLNRLDSVVSVYGA